MDWTVTPKLAAAYAVLTLLPPGRLAQGVKIDKRDKGD